MHITMFKTFKPISILKIIKDAVLLPSRRCSSVKIESGNFPLRFDNNVANKVNFFGFVFPKSDLILGTQVWKFDWARKLDKSKDCLFLCHVFSK